MLKTTGIDTSFRLRGTAESLYQTRLSVPRVTMSLPVFSGEGKYSDRWLNIWKGGLPPGQVKQLNEAYKRLNFRLIELLAYGFQDVSVLLRHTWT